jgi:hypothetical protein
MASIPPTYNRQVGAYAGRVLKASYAGNWVMTE